MRIGLDFDNTIACYDGAFHVAALERGWIPATLGSDKTSVRDHLRGRGRDADFTLLQGHVYGPGMATALPYPGVADFIARAGAAGHRVTVVSHRTRTPFAGPPHDLHAAARGFLARPALVAEGDVFLEETKEAKAARITALGCDVFVDDLPEILAVLPGALRRVLFDPDGHSDGGGFETHRDWAAIARALLG